MEKKKGKNNNRGSGWFVCSCLQLLAVVCSGLQWFAVVCSGLQWFAVVCSGLQWFAVVCSGMFGGLTCVCFFFCVFVLDHCTISIPVVVRNRGVVWVMVWKGSQELNHQNAEQETNLMLPVQVGKQLM
jgi:hypothetical protein